MIYPVIIVEGRGVQHFHDRFHVGRKKIRDNLGLAVEFCSLILAKRYLSHRQRLYGPHSKLFDAVPKFKDNAAIMATWLDDDELEDIIEQLNSHHAEYHIYHVDPNMIEKCRYFHWQYQINAYNDEYVRALERIGA